MECHSVTIKPVFWHLAVQFGKLCKSLQHVVEGVVRVACLICNEALQEVPEQTLCVCLLCKLLVGAQTAFCSAGLQAVGLQQSYAAPGEAAALQLDEPSLAAAAQLYEPLPQMEPMERSFSEFLRNEFPRYG